MNSVRPAALVTGGGSGFGRAIAVALAVRGCRVVVADIEEAGAAETAAQCGGDARVAVCDLTASGEPDGVISRAAEAFGRFDILVNNAGYGGIEDFFAMSAAMWDRTLTLNLRALALACAAAGRIMRAQRSGRIVNVTSPAARMGLPNYAAYAASKAGVDSITRAAAVALAPYGVLVNSVAPGMMDTEMQRSTETDLARLAGRDDVQRFLDERTARVPLGRRTTPEEMAQGVVWLALDAPPYVTAERLNLSGGLDKD